MSYEEMLHPVLGKVADNIDKVMVGKKHIAVLSLTAILANGHVLLEDVPGVGKTMMANALISECLEKVSISNTRIADHTAWHSSEYLLIF